MSKKAAELAGQMAKMLEVIGVLEERLAELKKMAGGKKKRRGAAAAAAAADPNQPPRAPRAPNSWILFTQRVEKLVRDAGSPFNRAVDSKKFCKELKDRKGYEWTDEEILAARRDWDPPTPVLSIEGAEEGVEAETKDVSICPTCTGVIEDDVDAHRACLRSVAAAAKAAGADPIKAVEAWSESVQSVPAARRPAALPLEPIHGRSRTLLRRPSAPRELMVQASNPLEEHSRPVTICEETVIEEY